MGNTANKPYRDEGSVAKRIHHIWIGSVIKPKERDYASIWAEVNNGSDMNENPSEPYQSRIWVDPNALMVGETKREIMRWAEWKALQDSQITDVKVFDQKMRDGGFRTRYTKRVLFWVSQQRYALNEKLSAANPSSLDEIRVLCIGALRAERLDGDPESITQTLLDQLSIAILDMQEVLQDGNFQDINTVLNKPEHAALKAAYLQELNLRQNMAAAADIARVLVLEEEGGVYADLDLLPRFKSSAFILIAQSLQAAGYVMPYKFSALDLAGSIDDWTVIPDRLLGAITDAVVIRSNLINGYQATSAYEILPGEAPGPFEISADAQTRQREILTRVVDSVLTQYYPQKFDCFHRLGALDPIPGFGFGFFKKHNGGSFDLKPNNQFIVSGDPTFIEDVYNKLKKTMPS